MTSDVVICRAGAITVSEICAAGSAAVLVPLVVSTTSHQRDNAVFMAQHGAAIHLPQAELTPQRLHDLIAGLQQVASTAGEQIGRVSSAGPIALSETEIRVIVALFEMNLRAATGVRESRGR